MAGTGWNPQGVQISLLSSGRRKIVFRMSDGDVINALKRIKPGMGLGMLGRGAL